MDTMTIYERALELVPNDSTIGLGSGRAADAFIAGVTEHFGKALVVAHGAPVQREATG